MKVPMKLKFSRDYVGSAKETKDLFPFKRKEAKTGAATATIVMCMQQQQEKNIHIIVIYTTYYCV